jgi:Fe-S-cluster-containing dehydrogenase component
MKAELERLVTIDPDKCTGCRACQMACSIKHFGFCSPAHALIKVHEFVDQQVFIPVICQACETATCEKVCPTNARRRLPNGAMGTDPDRCIGCRGCVYACPFNSLAVDPETGQAKSCDLCQDEADGPWCVRACALQKALRFVDLNRAATLRRQESSRALRRLASPRDPGLKR